MNGFFISITNNLLEDKHYVKMGNAVWLYMWIIDAMNDISEGQGIVNFGNPVTYEQVSKHIPSLSERTYNRMLDKLRQAGYINTHQAKYGLYITVNKPKKYFGEKAKQSSPAKSGIAKAQKTSSYAKSGSPAMPNLSGSYDKSGKAVYIKNNKTITKLYNKTNTRNSDDSEREEISKLYYQVIKAHKLPVLNHNTLRIKIKQMTTEVEYAKLEEYLTFVRDIYPTLDLAYKPQLNNALDIYTKRIQIANAVKSHIKDQESSKVFRV